MIDLTGLPEQVAPAPQRVRTAPTGTEPGIRWNGREGEISTEPHEEGESPKSWDDLLVDWGLDPTEVEVVPGSVEIRAWDANMGRDPNSGEVCTKRLRYYKARLQRRTFNGTTVDYDGLVDEIRKWKPAKRTPPSGDLTLLVNLADWQIGSADGRGTEAIIARVLDMIGEVSAYVTSLRKMGYSIGRMHVQGLGDLYEGCTGHYAMQEFSVQLDRRQQTRVIRRLIKTALTTWATRVEIITVGTVPGNHGECVDDQTEILTRDGGWVSVGAIEGDEVVATLNPDTQAFEWQAMTAWTAQSYAGEMHHYKASNIDLIVTPNHDCYRARWDHRNDGPDKWTKVKSAANTVRSTALHAGRGWEGSASAVIIPDYADSLDRVRNGRTFQLEDLPVLARLIGWYVSEGNGCLGKNGGRVCISQSAEKNPEHHAEIVSTLESLGFNPRPRWDQVRFSDRPMHDWLSANFGRVSEEKRLPRWFKDWPTELLWEFTLAYMKGDGNLRPDFTQTVPMTSTSDQLIDDMTEVMLKLGWRTNSSGARYERTIDGYVGSGRKLTANPRPTCEQPRAGCLHYEGMIYCPTVPNGLWFARRNGRTTVTGNSRKDGKAFTTFGDNDDVAVFESVAEMFQENPDLRERVLFTIPDQDMVQVFDLSGTIVAFAHAHQATRNSNGGKLPPAQAKVLTWWKDQSFGLQRPGDADLLVTGHYHHFSIIEHGHRTHLQCPAMDDGSIWFTNQSGLHSRAGTLAMLVGSAMGAGGYGATEILGSGTRLAS